MITATAVRVATDDAAKDYAARYGIEVPQAQRDTTAMTDHLLKPVS
ncbi:hypothetical protein [Actinosynnema sp. ALI-1.44]|nr:hypothetical protein [Actinosynnema sp. ALI-1.44]